MEIWVYILKCADGSFYVGNTRRSLEERVGEHNSGLVPGYTASRRPVELVHADSTNSLMSAFERERQLKGWSRAKKQALIDGCPELLPDLASRSEEKRKSPVPRRDKIVRRSPGPSDDAE